jgi:hypothetical protein
VPRTRFKTHAHSQTKLRAAPLQGDDCGRLRVKEGSRPVRAVVDEGQLIRRATRLSVNAGHEVGEKSIHCQPA